MDVAGSAMCLRGDVLVALHGVYLINGGGNTIVIAEGHGLELHNECEVISFQPMKSISPSEVR